MNPQDLAKLRWEDIERDGGVWMGLSFGIRRQNQRVSAHGLPSTANFGALLKSITVKEMSMCCLLLNPE